MPHSPTTRAPALEAAGLAKRFGDVVALDGLALRVAEGEIYGLLGPNGAGKTTALSILTTLRRPDAGWARVAGHDVVAERAAVRRAIGVVFQEPSLDRELTAREHLDLQARLHHLDARNRRVAEALARAGLAADADRPVRGLSGGLRRRLEIARGLLHRPRVLFLDEPTLGLDPAARAALWQQLRALHAEGDTTVFLTTHAMEEADALCQRVGIVDRGRLVVEGSPAELKAALGGDVVVIGFEGDAGNGVAAAALRAVAGVQRVSESGSRRLRVTLSDGPRRLPALLEALRERGVADVELHRPNLEHVFLHHTGHPFEPERLGDTQR